MEITLSYSELSDLIFKVSKEASKQTLQELGLAKTTLTRAQVEKTYGTAMFNQSKTFVKWQKKGNGKTSPVICNREDFEKFIISFNQELKPIKNVHKRIR